MHISKYTLVHSCKYIDILKKRIKSFQAHLSFTAFRWLVTDTDDPSSSADKMISCLLPLHLASSLPLNDPLRDYLFFFSLSPFPCKSCTLTLIKFPRRRRQRSHTSLNITPSVRAAHIAIPNISGITFLDAKVRWRENSMRRSGWNVVVFFFIFNGSMVWG